jgi:hypothetical protein
MANSLEKIGVLHQVPYLLTFFPDFWQPISLINSNYRYHLIIRGIVNRSGPLILHLLVGQFDKKFINAGNIVFI